MKKVKLKVVATGTVKSFDADHAERILKIPNSGWEKVEKYDKLQRTDKEQEELQSDSEGN